MIIKARISEFPELDGSSLDSISEGQEFESIREWANYGGAIAGLGIYGLKARMVTGWLQILTNDP